MHRLKVRYSNSKSREKARAVNAKRYVRGRIKHRTQMKEGGVCEIPFRDRLMPSFSLAVGCCRQDGHRIDWQIAIVDLYVTRTDYLHLQKPVLR